MSSVQSNVVFRNHSLCVDAEQRSMQKYNLIAVSKEDELTYHAQTVVDYKGLMTWLGKWDMLTH